MPIDALGRVAELEHERNALELEVAELSSRLTSADRLADEMSATISELLSQGIEACDLCSGFGRPDCPDCHGTGWANVRAIKAEAERDALAARLARAEKAGA